MSKLYIYPPNISSLTPSATRFLLDGSLVSVTEDTVVPSNNAPLPVKITSATGDINITAGDLNVQISHAGANYDSTRIGDGTTLAGVTLSNELKVSDATSQATLADIATNTASASAYASLTPIDFLDSGLVDSSSSNIPTTGLSVVASLASNAYRIEVVDDIGEYMALTDGADAILCYLPLGGGLVNCFIASGTNVKIKSLTGASITSGKIAMNFLGLLGT